jgi:hypothetical protein
LNVRKGGVVILSAKPTLKRRSAVSEPFFFYQITGESDGKFA